MSASNIAATSAPASVAAAKERPGIPAILHEWVITTDHKKLGVMYIVSGLLFFVVSGLMAALIRWQLVVPNNHFLSPQIFNRAFTMHGTAMVFLVGMPIIAGLMNYLAMLDAFDIAAGRKP